MSTAFCSAAWAACACSGVAPLSCSCTDVDACRQAHVLLVGSQASQSACTQALALVAGLPGYIRPPSSSKPWVLSSSDSMLSCSLPNNSWAYSTSRADCAGPRSMSVQPSSAAGRTHAASPSNQALPASGACLPVRCEQMLLQRRWGQRRQAAAGTAGWLARPVSRPLH